MITFLCSGEHRLWTTDVLSKGPFSSRRPLPVEFGHDILYGQKANYASNTEVVMNPSAQTRDSAKVSEDIASGGNLRFYWHTFKTNPLKVVVGVWETFVEVIRWLTLPRFPVENGLFTRFGILWRFIRAELNVPGGTTCLEAIWLTYAATMPNSKADVWIEVGCFKGLSVARLSLVARIFRKRIRVYDTFEGLPTSDAVYDAVVGGVNFGFKSGSYLGTVEEVRKNLEDYGVPELVTLVKGDVRNTLPDPEVSKISFAFFDVDLVESYRSCFAGVSHHIETGTLIVIHEASFAQIRQFIEDPSLWTSLSIPAPSIEYLAETTKIRSLLNLAILRW